MKRVGGIYLPRSEQYLEEKLREIPGYVEQYDDDLFAYARALPVRRCAVDVGAHVGLWSIKLAREFERVHAFEPHRELRDCLALNLHAENVVVHGEALGAAEGTVGLETATFSTMKTHVHPHGAIPLCTLDGYDLRGVDLIKVDCEGYDYFVLGGASETIRRERPLVIFEAKPGVSRKRYRVPQDGPRDLVERLGYRVLAEVRGNLVCYAAGTAPPRPLVVG